MPIKSIRGTKYYYKEQGSGTPLVLLHGFTGSGQNWEPFLTDFSRRFRVIVPDILGHGRSASPADPNRHQMAEVAADIIALLHELVNEPVHLLGFSMGGRLGLYTAVHFPHLIKSLILESSSPGLQTETEREARRKQDHQLADKIGQQGIEAFVNVWEQIPFFASQKALPSTNQNKLRQQRLQNNPQGLANSLRGMGTGQQPSLWPRLAQIQIPTLLLAGELDPKFVTINQKMGQMMPNATLQIIPNTGHNIHLEDQDRFSREIRNWRLETGSHT